MKNFLDKIFLRSNNLDDISNRIKNLNKITPVKKIFDSVNTFSTHSEIRYVGGCVRNIINNEKVNDIDLVTNLEPKKVCEALKIANINFHETGIEHGTITAIIDEYRFEITSLREDISTDGRHAEVKYTSDWKKDSKRRDFTINSIYSDIDGNLFDPYDGKKDLEKGSVKFIGNVDERIKEDYLRILRYLRFFLKYSKHPHNPDVLKKIKMNISGVIKLSKERLIDELKKIINIKILDRLCRDKLSLDLFLMIFPEMKNIKIFLRTDSNKKTVLEEADFILLLSLMIIDKTEDLNYFLYKFNFSKKDQKRLMIIDNFYKEKINSKSFSENNLNKILYYHGREAVNDILNFRIIKNQKNHKNLFDLKTSFKDKPIPAMPFGAKLLMTKYRIPEGKQLGAKLKMIEEEWVKNNFFISDQQIDNIIKN